MTVIGILGFAAALAAAAAGAAALNRRFGLSGNDRPRTVSAEEAVWLRELAVLRLDQRHPYC